MAEFAASLIALSEVGFRIGSALRDLIKTMKGAEHDINHIARRFEAHDFLTRKLSDNIEGYSKSQSLDVQDCHSQLSSLIYHCRPIYDNMERMLKQFRGSIDASISSVASDLRPRTRALWTRIKPKLEEGLRELGEISQPLQWIMTVLQLDYAHHSHVQGSLLYDMLAMKTNTQNQITISNAESAGRHRLRANDIASITMQTAALARRASIQTTGRSGSRRATPSPRVIDQGIVLLTDGARARLRRRSSASSLESLGSQEESPALSPWSHPSFDYEWTARHSSLEQCFMTLRDFHINPRHIGQENFNLPLLLDEIEIFSIVKLADSFEAGRLNNVTRGEKLSEVDWCIDVLRHLGERFEKEGQRRNDRSVERSGIGKFNVRGWSAEDIAAVEYLGLMIEENNNIFTVPKRLFKAEERNIEVLSRIFAEGSEFEDSPHFERDTIGVNLDWNSDSESSNSRSSAELLRNDIGALDINDGDEYSDSDSQRSHPGNRSLTSLSDDFCRPWLQRPPGGYTEYIDVTRLYYHKEQLAELAKSVDVEACRAFFEECAALKRRPHPLLRMRRDNYPAYHVPPGDPRIQWDKLSSREQAILRGCNLFDYDCIMEMLRRCPRALLKPSQQLEELKQARTEQGGLDIFQHIRLVKNRVRKGAAMVKTFKTKFTHFHWALLCSTSFVQPMHCRTSLYWPDDESIPRP